MSMDISVKGIVEPTEDYNKKLEAYYACEKAGIDIPDELLEYFNGEEPLKEGMEVKIDYAGNLECEDGYILIDLIDLPENVTKIKIKAYY